MNCRDFDQLWNQLLDSRPCDDRDGDRERRLQEHADACPSCLERHRRFEALRQAIAVWACRPDAAPVPTPGLAERVLEITSRPDFVVAGPVRPSFTRPRLVGFALAATAAAAVFLLTIGPSLLPRPIGPVSAADRSIGRGLFGGAVSDATAASWQLALLASEPAARLGKEMIGASFGPESGSPSDFADRVGLPSFEAESLSPEALDRMGEALAAGVRPLSTSARQAFGFLFAPSSDKLHRSTVPLSAKGA